MTNNNGIIERFEEAYKRDGFPPLAGSILGMFYVYNKKYLSFDEIVSISNASKGSVSKTLKLLIKLNRVGFIRSEEHKRKRLFFLNTEGVKEFVISVLDNYKKQDILLKECLDLRTDENKEFNSFISDSIAFNRDVLSFLEERVNKYFK